MASDIDDGAIEKANLGIYSEKSLVNLPDEFKVKYFDKLGSSFKIKEIIKKTK